MAALADVLAALAVALLRWWASREDLKASVRGRMALAAARQAEVALCWKADHPVVVDPADPLADFRVRDGAGGKRVSPDDPAPPGAPGHS